MTAPKKRDTNSAATPELAGRPKPSGSRQQTHHDQKTQTGSPQADRAHTARTEHKPGAK